MKRIVTAVVGAGLVVAAVGVARAISGEDSTPDAQAPTSSPTQPVDVSREFDPDLAKEQIKKQSEQLAQRIEAILGVLPVLQLGQPADHHYAHVRHYLEAAGRPIGANDLFIAAHALALDLTLVTANIREFSRVPNLRVENWLD